MATTSIALAPANTFGTDATTIVPKKQRQRRRRRIRVDRTTEGRLTLAVTVATALLFVVALSLVSHQRSCTTTSTILGVESLSLAAVRNSRATTATTTTRLWAKANTSPNNDNNNNNNNNDWIQAVIETTKQQAKNGDIDNLAVLCSSDDDTTTTTTTTTIGSTIRTRFFLVDTKHPGNVGSSARSIKTMGFFPEGLVVVNPHDSRVLGRKKCIDASSGATDVLENAVLVATTTTATGDDEIEIEIENQSEIEHSNSCLERAIREAFGEEKDDEDNRLVVCGTGMPVDMSHARASRCYLEPRPFLESLVGDYCRNHSQQQQDINNNNKKGCRRRRLNIAFVFGNERYGMTQEDMALCDVVLGIPTHPSFGSLNLATAVQIVAYDWRQALGGYYDTVDETETEAESPPQDKDK